MFRLDFEMRCPAGKKVKLYKKAKLEKFAPYLMKVRLSYFKLFPQLVKTIPPKVSTKF